jgi:hypothetical protein
MTRIKRYITFIKKYNYAFFLIGFFLIIFMWNYSTFLGIIFNTGYANGTVINTRNEGRSNYPYSIYTYTVDNKAYRGKQGGKYQTSSGYLIVYDIKNPKYSMIANYPYLVNDSLIKINKIDLSAVG